MTSKQMLEMCFGSIWARLMLIESQKEINSVENQEEIIKQIKSTVLSIDPEDANDYIVSVIKIIDKRIDNMRDIVSRLELPMPFDKSLPFNYSKLYKIPYDEKEWVNSEGMEDIIYEYLTEHNTNELQYYKVELEKIIVKLEEKVTALGNEWQIGPKPKLNFTLKKKEIASFFNLLYDLKIIDNEIVVVEANEEANEEAYKEAKKIKFIKLDLAKFIFENFTSQNKPFASVQTIYNILNTKNKAAGSVVFEILNEMDKTMNQK